jgi:hypothetical protein
MGGGVARHETRAPLSEEVNRETFGSGGSSLQISGLRLPSVLLAAHSDLSPAAQAAARARVSLRASNLRLPSAMEAMEAWGYGGAPTDPHALHLASFPHYSASSGSTLVPKSSAMHTTFARTQRRATTALTESSLNSSSDPLGLVSSLRESAPAHATNAAILRATSTALLATSRFSRVGDEGIVARQYGSRASDLVASLGANPASALKSGSLDEAGLPESFDPFYDDLWTEASMGVSQKRKSAQQRLSFGNKKATQHSSSQSAHFASPLKSIFEHWIEEEFGIDDEVHASLSDVGLPQSRKRQRFQEGSESGTLIDSVLSASDKNALLSLQENSSTPTKEVPSVTYPCSNLLDNEQLGDALRREIGSKGSYSLVRSFPLGVRVTLHNAPTTSSTTADNLAIQAGGDTPLLRSVLNRGGSTSLANVSAHAASYAVSVHVGDSHLQLPRSPSEPADDQRKLLEVLVASIPRDVNGIPLRGAHTSASVLQRLPAVTEGIPSRTLPLRLGIVSPDGSNSRIPASSYASEFSELFDAGRQYTVAGGGARSTQSLRAVTRSIPPLSESGQWSKLWSENGGEEEEDVALSCVPFADGGFDNAVLKLAMDGNWQYSHST